MGVECEALDRYGAMERRILWFSGRADISKAGCHGGSCRPSSARSSAPVLVGLSVEVYYYYLLLPTILWSNGILYWDSWLILIPRHDISVSPLDLLQK